MPLSKENYYQAYRQYAVRKILLPQTWSAARRGQTMFSRITIHRHCPLVPAQVCISCWDQAGLP